MANERELLSALAQGLRDAGVPNPERCTLRMRWSGLDLVVQVHWPDFGIPVKVGTTQVPYTDHIYATARTLQGPAVLQWMRETVPEDGLAILWAEMARIRVRYPHLAKQVLWPQGWPVPPNKNLVYAGTGLPYEGVN